MLGDGIYWFWGIFFLFHKNFSDKLSRLFSSNPQNPFLLMSPSPRPTPRHAPTSNRHPRPRHRRIPKHPLKSHRRIRRRILQRIQQQQPKQQRRRTRRKRPPQLCRHRFPTNQSLLHGHWQKQPRSLLPNDRAIGQLPTIVDRSRSIF